MDDNALGFAHTGAIRWQMLSQERAVLNAKMPKISLTGMG
ncbi:Uncharacterised protein [Salmonella enterica subsp. enterica]|uniref:Uncharacterized protein n=1 Tax=Salmonella enterica I TaxID=59201 RepID=A0A379X124_SALET|nr:Uncharacterised protein [Salmonella enterica subsp. enterica]